MVEMRRGLGRGLSALLEDARSATTEDRRAELGVADLPLELIHANPEQPRKRFNQQDLDDLAESIRQRGVIQPILVRPHPARVGAYEIVAGERRWRAAHMAELRTIPALSRELTTLEVMEIALIENIQRADLSVLEEARAYQAMMGAFSRNADDIAKVVGKSRSHVANVIRLLRLPSEIREHLEEGRLTAGHARALLERDDAVSLAEKVIRRGLNVRQTEALARQGAEAPQLREPRRPKDADTRALETDLSEVLGMEVEIRDSKGSGSLTVRYRSLEQLDELCRRMLVRPSRAH
jgi:ParB family chromosome partitioning protein